MDFIEGYARTADWVEGLIGKTTPEQYDNGTPCEKWTVRELLDHLVGGTGFFRAVMERQDVGGGGGAELPDVPAAAYRLGADAYLEILREPSKLEGTVKPPFGEMPATVFLGITVTDQVTHGWDLARATGQDDTIPPELIDTVAPFAQQAFASLPRSADIIGEPVTVPDSASDQDKLIAFLGRQP
jgi:uncharacterized protein (TIGR03086 family)